MPGRFEVVAEAPADVFDGAHNPSGMAALAAALRDAVGGRPLVAVLSVLDDKDAAGMLRELRPAAPPARSSPPRRNPRALPPATLASLCEPAGAGRRREIEADPRARVGARARLAGPGRRRRGDRLDLPVADLLSRAGAPDGRRRCERRAAPACCRWSALVAVVVALVILVFFALGYLFGRLFL